MPRAVLLILVGVALLAGCAAPDSGDDGGGSGAGNAVAGDVALDNTTWRAGYVFLVSRQVDGSGTTTDFFRDGDRAFAIPAGSRHVRVDLAIDGPEWPLAWELALHGNCEKEPAGPTHVQGPAPLHLEYDEEALEGAQCSELLVFVQAADDPTLPASGAVAVRARWTATVTHPVA